CQIVAFKQNDFADELRAQRKLVDNLDQLLPGLIVGVSLAREDHDAWLVGIVQNGGETVEVGKQQRRAFVRSKAPRKTKYHDVSIRVADFLCNAFDQRMAAAVALALCGHAFADFLKQLMLESLVNAPVVMIGDIVYAVPEVRVEQFVLPLVEMHVEQAHTFAREKGGHMHAVGDVVDWI